MFWDSHSSSGVILCLKAHSAMSGDIFGCTSCGEGSATGSILRCTGQSFTTKNYPSQNISGAKIEKPQNWTSWDTDLLTTALPSSSTSQYSNGPKEHGIARTPVHSPMPDPATLVSLSLSIPSSTLLRAFPHDIPWTWTWNVLWWPHVHL